MRGSNSLGRYPWVLIFRHLGPRGPHGAEQPVWPVATVRLSNGQMVNGFQGCDWRANEIIMRIPCMHPRKSGLHLPRRDPQHIFKSALSPHMVTTLRIILIVVRVLASIEGAIAAHHEDGRSIVKRWAAARGTYITAYSPWLRPAS